MTDKDDTPRSKFVSKVKQFANFQKLTNMCQEKDVKIKEMTNELQFIKEELQKFKEAAEIEKGAKDIQIEELKAKNNLLLKQLAGYIRKENYFG